MEIPSGRIEWFLKSAGFGVLLFLVWGAFSLRNGMRLSREFTFIGALWFIYNVTISLLFLIRTRPIAVSMNPVHWVVGLVTSFSGFLFSPQMTTNNAAVMASADSLIVAAILLGIATALTLGRSYDFLPALRGVKTGGVYRIVRHPMYLSSIAIKLGYTLRHGSIYNVLLLVCVVILYDRRARYEEQVMSRSNAYADYLKKVRYRFLPRLY